MRRPHSGKLRFPAASLLGALLLPLPLGAAAAAQEAHAPDSAALLLRQGRQARAEDLAASVRRALTLWEQAHAVAERRGDRAAQAEALHLRGEGFRALSVYDSAFASLNAALALRRAAGDRAGQGETLVELARLEMTVGHTRDAGARAREALALLDAPAGTPTGTLVDVEAGARTLLAAVLLRMEGRPDSPFVELRKALELRRRRGDVRGEGEVLQGLGDVHRSIAQLDSALAYYGRALALQERAGDLRGSAYTLRSIGLTHGRLVRRDLDLAYNRRAQARFREAGERRGEALTLTAISRYQRRTGSPDSAVAAVRQAVAQMREIGDRWGEAIALTELAINLTVTGHSDSVATFLRGAAERFHEASDPWAEAVVLRELGDEYVKANRSDSAVILYRHAAEIVRHARVPMVETALWEAIGLGYARLNQPDSARAAYRRSLRIARRIGERWTETLVLLGLADLQRARADREGLKSAVALYDSASATLSRMVLGIGGDNDRLTLVGPDDGPSANWTLSWLAREREVGARRARLAALAAGERGRAQGLLELMRRSRGRPTHRSEPTPPGADLAAEGQALLDRARDGGSAVLLYQLAGDTLLRWLALPAGPLLLFRDAVPRDSLAALVGGARGMLGADEAVVRGKGTRRTPPLEAPVPLAADPGALERLARLLLPSSLAARLPRGGDVVIVPSGMLNLVPFAALTLPDGEYLGSRHALRYAPSLATLGEAERRPAVSRGALARALVVGDPAMPSVTTHTGEEVQLDPLPGAGREADAVAARLGSPVLHGPAAGEKAVVALLSQAPLVHLATHGFAFAATGRAHGSFVALAPGDGDDGLLTVAEVLSRTGAMRAELVVLSACQSGLGSLRDGEGTVGLQRAFLARGARSVMVSLWSVSDRATEALMRGFYGHWLGDPDRPGKAEALRRAQADVRGTPGMESPLFWAAFQLAGAR